MKRLLRLRTTLCVPSGVLSNYGPVQCYAFVRWLCTRFEQVDHVLSRSGQSDGVVPAASSDSSLRGTVTASAIPGFLQGPECKSVVVVHSSTSDSTNIRGDAFVDKGKKRKRCVYSSVEKTIDLAPVSQI